MESPREVRCMEFVALRRYGINAFGVYLAFGLIPYIPTE